MKEQVFDDYMVKSRLYYLWMIDEAYIKLIEWDAKKTSIFIPLVKNHPNHKDGGQKVFKVFFDKKRLAVKETKTFKILEDNTNGIA